MADPINRYNIADKLDAWLDKYGKVLNFEAKQALIPIRDYLLSVQKDTNEN